MQLKSLGRRLTALEARGRVSADVAVEWTIPIRFVDQAGQEVGEIPAEPLPARSGMGQRSFDYDAVVARLLHAMGYDDEALR